MTWTALIPLNVPTKRKSRLSPALSVAQREALAEELYRHVVDCVERVGVFSNVVTLSPALPTIDVSTRVWLQHDCDLNAEFARARSFLSGPLLVLNADLPLLHPLDLRALVQAADDRGCALAADRHGTGTNAVAVHPAMRFRFAFGPDSLAAHAKSAPRASVLRRTGLSCDLDTPADIAHVLASGQALPAAIETLLREGRVAARSSRAAHAR